MLGRDTAGACTWIYTGLSTSRPKDFCFTILNVTYVKANVEMELFFEEMSWAIRSVKKVIKEAALTQLCITGEGVGREECCILVISKQITKLKKGLSF